MNILQAVAHEGLFGSHFAGETWQAWKTFLRALFALPMSDPELAIYRQHTERQTPPAEPFKEACLVIGRRGGKSRILALIAVYLACFKSYSEYLAPGEVGTIAVIATNRDQARAIFRFATGLLHAVPALEQMIEEETEAAIVLSNRCTIEIHTASFRVTRGYTLVAALCDETAFWRDETSANPDVEIFRALRPGLATIPGAVLLNASSPYRKAGVLHSTFARHFGKDDSRTLVWRASSLAMNPKLDPAIVAEAYEDDAEAAASEFGAEFRNDLSDFVSRDVVEACVVRGRVELLPAAGQRYVAFVDPSGGSADSMTLAIAHRDKDFGVLDVVRERRPPFSPAAVVAEFCMLLKQFRVHEVVGDRYAGEWAREPFRSQGINYKLSDQPKAEIYLNALPLLNSGKIELLDVPRLTSQLCGLERRVSRGGRDSIDHPVGQHDDLANSALGALLLVRARQPMKIDPKALERMMWPGQGLEPPWV